MPRPKCLKAGSTPAANVEALVLQGAGNISGTGNALANSIFGNAGANTLDGGGGADQLIGNAGNGIFVFRAGNGAAPGDSLQFVGFGITGAAFTQVGVNLWQVHSGLCAHDEFITLGNGAAVDARRLQFCMKHRPRAPLRTDSVSPLGI